MSRITKAIAEDVAKQLVATKVNELTAIKTKLAETVADLYHNSIPKEVTSLFKKHPKYLHTTTTVNVTGAGINGGMHLDFSIALPSKVGGWNTYLNLPDDAVSEIVEMANDIESKASAIRRLRRDIETAIFSLRTYANVEKEFPEAFALLPVSKVNTALAININSIRKEIK